MNRLLNNSLFTRLSLFLLIAVGFSACTKDTAVTPEDPSVQNVSGTLHDEQGYIVPNAIVEVLSQTDVVLGTDTSDEDGNWTVTGLPSSFTGAQLRITHEDFVASTLMLENAVLNAGGKSGILLALEHEEECCGKFTLTISNESAGREAEIKLRKGDRLITKVYSDSTGVTRFDHVCPGDYNIRIYKAGYKVIERTFSSEECDSSGVSVTLEAVEQEPNDDSCCQGVLSIVPIDSATNTAISGLQVKISRNGVYRQETSGSNGVTFREVCSGTYGVRIGGGDKYRVIEFSITMDCNDTAAETRIMSLLSNNNNDDSCCNNSISVTVKKDGSTDRVAGATVKVRKGGVLIESASTNGDGVASVDGLCKGTYSILIVKDGFTSSEFAIELNCDDHESITKELSATGGSNDSCCNGRMALTLNVDGSTTLISGATVKLYRGNTLVATKTTSTLGVVVFEELCKGSYSLGITKDGFTGKELSFSIECNGNVALTKALVSSGGGGADSCCKGLAAITIKDATTGARLANVTVKLWKGGQLFRTGTTNGDGLVKFLELCDGSYGVSMIRDGYTNAEFDFTLDCKQAKEFTKTLTATGSNNDDTCQTASIKVRVRKAETDAEYLSGVSVTVKRGDDVITTGTTSTEGWYVVEGLSGWSTYTLIFDKDGYNEKTVTFTFQNDCTRKSETIGLIPE